MDTNMNNASGLSQACRFFTKPCETTYVGRKGCFSPLAMHGHGITFTDTSESQGVCMTHPSSAPFSGMKPGVRALRAGAALLLAALLLVPYPSGAAARISGENAPVAARADGPHIFHLKNGLTIAVKEDSRFPLASVRLYVNAGSAWEQPGEAGISHLLEHMVFKGSKTGPKGVDKRVENAGGYLNASTSFDETIYLTDLPAAQWKTALRAVRDLAFDPLLRQADLDAEREVVLAEKKQRGDSPWTRLFHESFGLALKGTPYERPVIGYEDTLRAATPTSMRAYIQRLYDPRDMLLMVAGAVKADEVVKEAGKLFGDYANRNVSRVPDRIDPASLARGTQVRVVEGPWNKALVSVLFPMPGEGDVLLPAADVLARLLSGDDTALLPRSLRLDRHVVDDVGASAMALRRVGVFMIMSQMDADKVPAYTKELGALLRGLSASGFSDAAFARAKLNLEDDFYRAQETVAGMADLYGDLAFHSPGDPDGQSYLAAIRGVSRAQVQEVIDAWIRPEAMTLVALTPGSGNSAAQEDALRRTLAEAWPQAPSGHARAAGGENAATARAGTRLNDEVISLGEGRTLVLRPDRSLPYVSATLLFEGGDELASGLSGLDVVKTGQSPEGLASLTADVLVSSTKKRDYAAMSAYLADRAAGLSAGASSRGFSLSLDAPSRFSGDIFALLAEILDSPAFRKNDLERVKRDHLAAIASQEESVSGLLGRNLNHFLFPDCFYGYRAGGTAQSIAAVSRADLLKFWKAQSARPWVLSVAGDIDRDTVLAFARSLPVPAQGAQEAERNLSPAWAEKKTLSLTLPGREQAAYIMLFPTVPLENPDAPALQLLSASLSGFGGLLHQELREKQSLGYSVSPTNWAGQDAGFLGFTIIASPENLDKAEAGFMAIAREITQKPLPAETVDRAKAMLEAQYYRSQQSRAGRAAAGAGHALRGRPLDYGKQALDKALKLTPQDLLRVAQKYIRPGDAYTLTVTP